MRPCLAIVSFFVLSSVLAAAQQKQQQRQGRGYPPSLPGAKVEVYKTIGDVSLNIYIFTPDGYEPTDSVPP